MEREKVFRNKANSPVPLSRSGRLSCSGVTFRLVRGKILCSGDDVETAITEIEIDRERQAGTQLWPFVGLDRNAYSLLCIDPPWTFRTYSPKGWGKSAQRHYDCMTLGDIRALPVRDLAAKDCLVWLWATAPLLDVQIDVLKGWGARYVSSGAWCKTTAKGGLAFGTGYTLRSSSEPFLLGAFGKPKIVSRSVRSVVMAPVREHSRKPDEAYTAARALVPYGRAADIFSRQTRDGWDGWGNQATAFDEVLL